MISARRVQKDFIIISAVFFTGLYLSFYNPLIFGEYADVPTNNAAVGQASNEAKSPDGNDWFVIESNSLTIYCKQDVDLKAVARKLSKRGLFVNGVYGPNPASAPSEKIAYMTDKLLKRSKEILDMWPDKMHLNIRIFKTREDLAGEYFKIFNSREEHKSFFIYKYATIYTSEEDLSDSVLAHEMGHAIVDHYFTSIPPVKIRELLASYVDMHLDD